jgi:hypothetical protein
MCDNTFINTFGGGECLMRLLVNVKHLGKRRNSVEAAIFELENKPETVGDFIEEMVKVCVQDYKSRQEKEEVLQIFSKENIEDKAVSGKIAFGCNYGNGVPSLCDAIDNAKQSFLDGIVVIFIDDIEQKALEDKLEFSQDSCATFVRMTMLSGRLW